MRFSQNGYYIERYVKCATCGMLVYGDGIAGTRHGKPCVYCTPWCVEWAALTDRETGYVRLPIVQAQLEHLLMSGLLLLQPSNYSQALAASQQPAAPRTIKRAMELIEAHPEDPLTVADLAHVAGHLDDVLPEIAA